jgi:hypothetical protein
LTKTYITGQLEPFSQDVRNKFQDAENRLSEMNRIPINPLKINAYQLAPWPVRLEMLSACDAIFLLNDFTQSKESLIEKYISEITGKEILFQSLVEENINRDCFERDILARVTGAIEAVTGKKFEDYKEENRKPEIFYPRIIFSHECSIQGLPIERIAYYLNRDGCTIKHHLRRYNDNYRFVKDFRIQAEKVVKMLALETETIKA